MRAVNLLPKDAIQRRGLRHEDPTVLAAAALGAVVVLALSVGFARAHGQAGTEQHSFHAAQAQLDRLTARERDVLGSAKPSVPIVPVPSVTSEQQPRLAALSTALSTRIAWDEVLRQFSLVMPSDITVTSLAMNAPDPAGSAGQTFTLSGTAYSHDAVARLLSRLMLVPSLSDVTLSSSQGDSASGTVSFNITAAVKGGDQPADAATTPAATTEGATS